MIQNAKICCKMIPPPKPPLNSLSTFYSAATLRWSRLPLSDVGHCFGYAHR